MLACAGQAHRIKRKMVDRIINGMIAGIVGAVAFDFGGTRE